MMAQGILDSLSEQELSDRFSTVLDKSNQLTDWEKTTVKFHTQSLEVYPVTWGEDEYLEYHAYENDKEICVIEEYLNKDLIHLLEIDLD